MSTAKKHQDLPWPADELEEVAAHYDAHDTSAAMDSGRWVEPQPATTKRS
jgi:hypothetical protein